MLLSKHIGNGQSAVFFFFCLVVFLLSYSFKHTLIIILGSMSRNAQGRCHYCCKKHTVPVFGSDEEAHTLLQKLNLRLVVLNTVCSPCIVKVEDFLKRNLPDIHSFFEEITVKKAHIETEFTSCNTGNLEIMEKTQVDKNFQTGKTRETEAERSVDSIDTENEAGINNLQVHENAGNIKKKQLMCEFCQKKFNHAGDLNKHRRKHTGEQPYACNMCQRKFTTSSNLVRHQQIHLGIKPFHCQICKCTFTRKVKLSAHLVAKHHKVLKSDQSMV